MIPTTGYAVKDSKGEFTRFEFERRDLKPHDIQVKIAYCGICHSDIHQARNEWNNSIYPMVPGHEIVGHVVAVGNAVKRFKVNDVVGVGCFVDSCRECHHCKADEQQFCEKHIAFTYNGTEMDLQTPTYGGYSSQIVIDEFYALKVSDKLPLEQVAPLLCAGITTYSPLRRFNVGPGKKVGIVGLGGLGHMAVKLAASMGADVTVLSTSPSKENDAKRLGAHHFVLTTKDLKSYENKYDLILDTVSAPHDANIYLNLLNRGGVLVVVGVPTKPFEIPPFSLIQNRRTIAGSLIGGIKETQEMLDYCAAHNITADVEVISFEEINAAYERTIKGDVKYRFVIDVNR